MDYMRAHEVMSSIQYDGKAMLTDRDGSKVEVLITTEIVNETLHFHPGTYDLIPKTKSIDNEKAFLKSKGNKFKYSDMIYSSWSKCSAPTSFVSKVTGDSAIDSSAPTGDLLGLYKKVLLPIIDRNPYLSEATRQAAATTTALAKKYGAEITVVVIDENAKESINDHDLRIKNIRWHLAQGGYEEFGLLESLGEGKVPAAIIGEIADDLSLDLVVLSMESIHSKHIDGNLLPEFVPCPIMLLPL
ncbi:hypothetical protein L7F22_045517 [Adiantum nelumboides]|nr:hypothetical protein [Adiantum nelumboides]